MFKSNQSIPLIVVDVETSGLDSQKCSILSIGAVNMADGNTFYEKCRPFSGAVIDDGALDVNGFSRDEIQGFDYSEEEILKMFILWFWEQHMPLTFAGQNPSFDKGFIESACLRHGILFPFSHDTVDLHSMAFAWLIKNGKQIPLRPNGKPKLSLDDVCKLLEIDGRSTETHTALEDVLIEAECLEKIIFM